jgi:hypothetical protein
VNDKDFKMLSMQVLTTEWTDIIGERRKYIQPKLSDLGWLDCIGLGGKKI